MIIVHLANTYWQYAFWMVFRYVCIPIKVKNNFLNYRLIILLGIFLVGVHPSAASNGEIIIKIPVVSSEYPNSVVIPFSKDSRLIMFKADIEGHRGSLILDTGASGLVLNSAYYMANRSLMQSAMTAVGLIENVESRRLSDFQLDEFVITRKDADIVDLVHIERLEKTKILGLIGYDVIKEFETFFNYRERYIRLTKVNRRGHLSEQIDYQSPKIDSINFTLGNHLPIIEVTIEGKRKRMGIDSGAEYNLLNIESTKDIIHNFKLSRRIRMRGADEQYKEALGGHLYRVKLKGKYPCAGMGTMLTGFDEIIALAGKEIDGILGYEFLSPWMFSINYKKRRLYLHRIQYKKP